MSILLLIVFVNFQSVSIAQDGNNFSDQFNETPKNNNPSSEYRENYLDRIRNRNNKDRYRVLRSTELPNFRVNTNGQFSSVMRSPGRSSSSSRSGAVRSVRGSGNSGGGINPIMFTPPSLMRVYLSGGLTIDSSTTELSVEPSEIEMDTVEEIRILSPSELLFEEGVQYFRQRKYREAMRHFDSLLEINPDDASKSVIYGLCFLAMKNYDKAAEIILASSTNFADPEELYTLIQSIYGDERAFLVHYKQLELKLDQTDNEEIFELSSVLHAVKERYS